MTAGSKSIQKTLENVNTIGNMNICHMPKEYKEMGIFTSYHLYLPKGPHWFHKLRHKQIYN